VLKVVFISGEAQWRFQISTHHQDCLVWSTWSEHKSGGQGCSNFLTRRRNCF